MFECIIHVMLLENRKHTNVPFIIIIIIGNNNNDNIRVISDWKFSEVFCIFNLTTFLT